MTDGTPAEEWSFLARRLSEPDRQRATHPFAYVTFLDRMTKAHVAKDLPTVLSDVCFGSLPKLAAEGSEPRRLVGLPGAGAACDGCGPRR